MPSEPLDEKAIFNVARQIGSAEARADYLRQACGTDAGLRERVEVLLHAYEEQASFLESPPVGVAPTIDQPASESPGTVIGPYKLVEPIGEGGMGTVWMAQQTDPVKRLVAVKLIKPGMDSKQVIARFEAERQALALMDHPNIARVLDGGTTPAGRPYFVMDLVKGVPITRYCDDHHLTPRQRLELFVPVCQAVQHAHQKGVIHRDLKPSNVLVALYDGRPVPKVIDFGVAKAAGPALTDKTLVTGFGAIVGTLEYMSPEQAEVNQLDIDTRSDIYSLGVLLYELLTGSPPFSKTELAAAGVLEMLRVIREQEPSKPSTKLSTAEGLPTLAANRGTEPAKLTRLVRGELDWIVMKALEKDRSRRYETANGLATDLQRYLADEPVLACPPSVGYRLRKFARRNRGAMAAAALVAAAMVVGTAVSIWQAVRATRAETLARLRLDAETDARKEALANFRKAQQAVNDYFTLVSQSTLLDVPGLQPLRKQLLDAARKYYESFARQRSDDPAVRVELAAAHLRLAQLFQMMGESERDVAREFDQGVTVVEELLREHPADSDLYRPLAGFSTTARELHEWTFPPTTALPRFERAAELWEQFASAHPALGGFRKDLAAIYMQIRAMNFRLARHADSVRAMEKAHALRLRDFAENPATPENREHLASSHVMWGHIFQGRGRMQEAAGACQKAAELREMLVADFPDSYPYLVGLAEAYRYAGWFLADAGHKEEGLTAARRAVELHQKAVAKYPDVPRGRAQLAESWGVLGRQHRRGGNPGEAKDAHREAQALLEKLTAEFPARAEYWRVLASNRHDVTDLFLSTGQPAEAATAQRAAVEAAERAIECADAVYFDWDMCGMRQRHLGNVLRWGTGRLTEAEQAYRRALETYRREAERFPAYTSSQPKHRWEVAWTHAELGHLLATSGRAGDAADQMRRAVALLAMEVTDFANDDLFRHALARFTDLASALASGGNEGEVVAAYRKLLASRTDHAGTRNSLARLLANSSGVKLRNPAQAIEHARKAVELAPEEGGFWSTLGMAHYRAGDWTASIEALNRSRELLGDRDLGFNAFFLAMAHANLGHGAEARTWFDRAVAWTEKNAKGNEELRRFRAEAEVLLRAGPKPEQLKVPPRVVPGG